MRVPRVRFTVRRMMIVVVFAASILAAIAAVERRREQFRRKAQEYSRMSNDLFVHGYLFGKSSTFGPSAAEVRISDEYQRRSIRYLRLKEKYDRAARYPWVPLAPDPPEPR